MREYMELGPTPCDEPCEQLGPNYNRRKALRECRAYARQLERQHGAPPEGAYFGVKGFAHDFGTYHETVIYFDTENEAAMEYAYKVEGDTPANWDETAKLELTEGETIEA
jgi:hypothetical protein